MSDLRHKTEALSALATISFVLVAVVLVLLAILTSTAVSRTHTREALRDLLACGTDTECDAAAIRAKAALGPD